MTKGRKSANILGKTFGEVTVLARVAGPDKRNSYWLTRCSCGREKVRKANELKVLTGCASCAGKLAKPNKSGCDMREYNCWGSMVRRCHNPWDKVYKWYGARGITVCEEWRQDFWAFYRDMGEMPTKHSIERVDNDKGYSKENCIWAPRSVQCRNRRNNIKITLNGITKIAEDWLQEFGLSRATFDKRRERGWTLEDAISRPLVFDFKAKKKLSETVTIE